MTKDPPHPTPPQKRWWNFWGDDDVQRHVRHLEIDYSIREREKQIRKIVDDNGFKPKLKIFFVASSGFLASSYSLFATNVIMPSLEYVYAPCNRLSGNISEVIDLVTLVGAVIGMISIGLLADRAGRKKLYGLELAILIVGTMGVVQASEGFVAHNQDGSTEPSMDIYDWISFWRFMLGFGIGAEYPLSAIITAEWAPTESRGTMLAAVFAMQSFSRLLAFAISLGVVKDSNLASLALGSDTSKLVVDRAWRLTIGLGVIPAAIAIILRLTIPETPRYYADIMKDLRKAVKTAFKVYKRYKKHHTEHNSVNSGPSRQGIDETNDRWFEGVWDYLFGSRQVWRRLANISALWGIMDVAWYGMGLDSPSALSTLAFDPSTGVSSINSKRSGAAGCDDQLWNTDSWNTGNTIDHVLKDNSVRSLLIVSIASFLGSMAAIVTINRFRRKSILVATFLLLSVLFAVCGGTLLSATRGHRSHVVSTVFYALLQFMFNLGPNTVIFILAAELFPTVYRGTFFGIAAAIGKIGAIIIRAVIGRTGNSAIPLAHRLLAFIPLMLLAAYLSALLPNVQYLPRTPDAEGAVVQTASTEAEKTPPVTDVPAIQNGKQPTSQREQVQRASVDSISSHGSSSSEQERNSSTQTAHSQNNFLKTFFGRLQNMALEDIAPNPAWDRGKDGEMKSKGPSLPETSAAQASGALPAASLGGNEVVGLNPVVTGGAFQPIILSCGYVDQDH